MEKKRQPNWLTRSANSASLAARGFIERQIPFFPIGWIEKIQRQRLRSIIRHAYETVPFYRRAMNDRGLRPADFRTIEDLQQLPLIDGMMIRTRTEDFVSSKYKDENSRLSFHSSGTQSHVRRVIYYDRDSALRKLANNERDRAVLNSIVGKGWRQKQLFIVPPPSQEPGPGGKLNVFWNANTVVRQRVADRQRIAMDRPLEEVVERINEVKPHLVFTYGSFIDQFFRYLSDRKPNIDLPRVWVYGADMLSWDRRSTIEEEFGCIVYSTYQSVETGRLGFQCERRDGFHLNVDLCAVQVVDQEGKTVEPGQTGSLVISNLHNRAMVLLNYNLEDMGSLAAEACSCGRSLPVLERLEGRSSDVIRFRQNRNMSAVVLEGICRHELKRAIQVQIVQTAPNQIIWRIVPFSDVDIAKLKSELILKTRSVLGDDMNVAVEIVEQIPRTSQGKFQKLISEPLP